MGAKDDEVGGDNWCYKMCKAPVTTALPTNQHPAFLQAGCPSRRPTNSVKALKGKGQKRHLACRKLSHHQYPKVHL